MAIFSILMLIFECQHERSHVEEHIPPSKKQVKSHMPQKPLENTFDSTVQWLQ
ncbi:hypothetical protein P7K49_000490 [Saguinus oedipus]|uniref:Uncharacterized protein n=1 Tax=Saguinus oedipus TaxID=9490 RepID=A0ABQ9WBV2_SAGOE|nr:hypothetical protein P7K49_000490 [Saguinus oedipus]